MADNNQQGQGPAAAAPAAPLPPVAVVMPAPANNNNWRRIQLAVAVWSLLNAVVFGIVLLVASKSPCHTKSVFVFRCLALTDKSAAELSALVDAGLWCATSAEASVLLHMVLSKVRTKTATRGWWRTCCGRWASAAVDAMAWVALAATVGVHCVEVASGSVGLAAHPDDNTYFYVAIVVAFLCLILDLLALGLGGLLLYCSRRRRKLLGQLQVHGEV